VSREITAEKVFRLRCRGDTASEGLLGLACDCQVATALEAWLILDVNDARMFLDPLGCASNSWYNDIGALKLQKLPSVDVYSGPL